MKPIPVGVDIAKNVMQAHYLDTDTGLLAGYGEVVCKGHASLVGNVPDMLARLFERLPDVLIDSLREQLGEVERTDKRIADIERRIRELSKDDPGVKAVSDIPGVGFLTATAVVASMGNADAFRSGHELATWVGLVPRQTGMGGKIQPLGISKRGDKYLRKLPVNGAHGVIQNAREPGSWLTADITRGTMPSVGYPQQKHSARK